MNVDVVVYCGKGKGLKLCVAGSIMARQRLNEINKSY